MLKKYSKIVPISIWEFLKPRGGDLRNTLNLSISNVIWYEYAFLSPPEFSETLGLGLEIQDLGCQDQVLVSVLK